MASSSKASAPIAFLLALNLVFFTLVSSQTPSPPPPPPSACPAGLLSLGTCTNLLDLLLLNATLGVGNNTASPCCRALGLVGVNVRACICQALAARLQILLRLLSINVTVGSTVNLTVAVNAMVSTCNLTSPIVGSGDCIITI
ncbi:14 kDa proline-rich protein DC2.15-like protein [Corchorus olitorius]|uniref:14 kDa proline-rich protein DC2.15-like protein n=1 Tax=Corchorus olitorius TaxID=93759 RepID=A0A1R3KG30_9ROSI|nr:14 kDa proline-rich protein DC2.15-like protein [Corchorus olitorius]